MFPLEFPLGVLKRARPDDVVLDPFCGRGTTLFAARALGLVSAGVDVNPVAVALARAKLVGVGPGLIERRCQELLDGPDPQQIPRGEFWKLAFGPRTLKDLCRLREGLLSTVDTATDTALRAIVLGAIHGPVNKVVPSYLSNQMPRTYATKPDAAIRYWRRHELQPAEVDVLEVVAARARRAYGQQPRVMPGSVVLGDAATEVRKFRRRFSWVITSPPYYGMRTYVPDQWLRNWFIGGPASVTYDMSGQLPQASPKAFVTSLRDVWRACAQRSTRGARMIVRFGAMPSIKSDPSMLMSASLDESGWRLTRIESAGRPHRQRRQAHQMGSVSSPIEEIDCFATRRA